MAELIELSDEELKELQYKSHEIARYVTDFCSKHDLRVYYYAGSLLGCIREEGFIPWDDDIDLIMPAPDFNKLVELWDEFADTDHYALCKQSRYYNDHTLTASIRDNYTTFVTDSTVNSDVNQGLAIDIEPLHACPSTRIGQNLQLLCAAGCSLFKASRVPARQKGVVAFASKLLLGIFRSDRIRFFIWNNLEKIATIPDRKWDKAEFVREFTMFPYITWMFPREWFDEAVYRTFEGEDVPVPVGFNGYLTKRYGEYMTPPPLTDRRPEHRIVFLDLHTPFKEYRGSKYLTDI